MGLEEFGGGGRRSFGGSEEFCGGRMNFGRSEEFFLGGGAPKEFWEVEGVLGGSEEFWGGRRSFGGGHRSLGEWSVEFSRCWAGGG